MSLNSGHNCFLLPGVCIIWSTDEDPHENTRNGVDCSHQVCFILHLSKDKSVLIVLDYILKENASQMETVI